MSNFGLTFFLTSCGTERKARKKLTLMGQFQVSDANCSCSANICNSLATEFTTQFQVQIARGGSAVANLLSIT
jgi:hypothetical protein